MHRTATSPLACFVLGASLASVGGCQAASSPQAPLPDPPPAREAPSAPAPKEPAPGASSVATPEPPAPPAPRPIGPFTKPFSPGRDVYYVIPPTQAAPRRLIANLHGMCNPPAYACGYWATAASEAGFLVCPTGNSTCGHAMFDAPTWTEPLAKMDEDLERAVAVVSDAYPGELSRDGAVLTGFSKGGYDAPMIAKRHPGRWPYLVINEADVSLSAAWLRAAGVRAVAFVAGEKSGQIRGERSSVARLVREGFPAKLWVMPGAGHFYSANIDEIMREAVAWVTSQPGPAAPAGAEADAR